MTKVITLSPMSDSEFLLWLKQSKQNYCLEIEKTGFTKEEAKDRTERDFSSLLPDGKNSKDHYLFSIMDTDGAMIGSLWFGIKGAQNNRKAFIYDIVLNEDARGKGFGKKVMELCEGEVKKLGLHHIGLHVFGHNKIARGLYEKMGYEITNLVMEKKLN